MITQVDSNIVNRKSKKPAKIPIEENLSSEARIVTSGIMRAKTATSGDYYIHQFTHSETLSL